MGFYLSTVIKLELQRQQLLQERQQFHLEQLRAAEFRQRQIAAQQLINEGKLNIPQISQPPPQIHMGPGVVANNPVGQQPQPQQIVMMTANPPMPAAQAVASPLPSIVSVQQSQVVAQQPSPQQPTSRPPSAQPPPSSTPQPTSVTPQPTDTGESHYPAGSRFDTI